MKVMKRLGALALVLCLLATLLPVAAFAQTVSSGTCGENLTWTLENDGTLTISGTGAMDSNTLWKSNQAAIRAVVIQRGVTGIGNSAFSGCVNLRSVLLPTSVTSVGYGAFADCSQLSAVFYRGTQSNKNGLSVSNNNNYFNNAQWHYEVAIHTLGSQTAYHCGNCDLYYRPDGFGAEFADVSKTSWQIKFANYACVSGLMAGKGTDRYGKTIFDPNKSISREEFVQVLYNAEDKPAVNIPNRFPDVKTTWYTSAVLWADFNSVASGMGNGNFGIGMNITRQDLAMMLYKYAKMKDCDLSASAGEINRYADGGKVAGYAKTAMDWAVTNGILSGKGTAGDPVHTFRLDPAGTATRAECAAMLKNFITAFDLHGTQQTECQHPNLKKTVAQAASCTENGNIDYWYCADCTKYFRDANGYEEITYEDTVITAAGHSYSKLWSSDDIYHWHAATCEHSAEISQKQKHTLNANNICTVCQRQVNEVYHTITYMNLKGAQAPAPTQYSEKAGVASLPTISAEGYRFLGWYTAPTGGVQVKAIPVGSTVDYELWALWETEEYTITYNCGRGRNAAQNPVKYTAEDKVVLEAATLQNYTFAGWYDENGNLVTQIEEGTTGNLKLKAAWATNRNRAHPISEIENPVYDAEIFASEGDEYAFVFYLGYIENVPFGWIGQPYNHEGATDHTVQYSTSESTANSISRTTETATTNTRGWQTEVSVSSSVEAECPGVAKASVTAAISSNQSGSTERTSTDGRTVTYSQEYVSSFTSTDTITKDSPVGWYRYVNYATVDVFAAITYNASENKYYISNINVVRDITSGWDYSFKSAAFDDEVDTALPFESFDKVEAFVQSLTEGTEGLVYSLSDDKSYATVIGYEGDDKDVEIPTYYVTTNGNRVPVIAIKDGTSGNTGVFANKDITSVRLSGNMTAVARYAFYNCKSLKTVETLQKLVTIDNYAFYGCEALEFTIPESVVRIGNYAFTGCKALDTVTISKNVDILGTAAFTDCGELDMTVIPADRYILQALSNTNATNVYIDLSEYTEGYSASLFDVVIPDTVSNFTVKGDGKDDLFYVNFESYADYTAIQNVDISSCRLKIHSPEVSFNSVYIYNSANEPAVQFCNENTKLWVSNEITVTGYSHNEVGAHAVVCNNLTVQSVKGINAEICLQGTSGTAAGQGILASGDVTFSGYMDVAVRGGHGKDGKDALTVGSDGATAISASKITVDITGNMEITGGSGGDGFVATAHSGQNGTDGGDAGNGGNAAQCEHLEVIKAVEITVTGGRGGNGGSGLEGKTGVIMLTYESYKNGGNGGDAGNGGNGGHAFTGTIKISADAGTVSVCGGRGGAGGRGGNGGSGGTSGVYFIKEPAGYHGGDAGDGGNGGDGGDGLTPGKGGTLGSAGTIGYGTTGEFGVFGGYFVYGANGDPGSSGDPGNEGKTLTVSE